MAGTIRSAAKISAKDFGFRWLHGLRAMPRAHSYPLMLGVLALVVPAGLLISQAIENDHLYDWHSIQKDNIPFSITYIFLTVITVLALVTLGFFIGRWFDRVHLQAITDPLTGLYNRRHFGDKLAEEIKRTRRYGTETCVLSIDLDRLKFINDHLGHRVGDHALVAVAQCLSQITRDTDVVARVGGDEFAVLLPETTSLETQALVSRILASVSQKQDDQVRHLTVSIGVARLPHDNTGLESTDVMEAADCALYLAKSGGGGFAVMAKPLINQKTTTAP